MTLITANDLRSLAARINAEHDAAEGAARTALDHARTAGEKLLLAKAQVEHGRWLPWLKDNCPRLAERTASAYMRLARHWPTLESKSATVADLTINQALQLLAAPSSVPDESPEQSETEVADPVAPVRADVWPTAIPHITRNTGNQQWHTPAEYVEAARAVLGTIDLDPASNVIAQETVQAAQFFTREEDGLSRPWGGKVFLNPPYSHPEIGLFANKLAAEVRSGAVESAIILTNNASDTGWFHQLASVSGAICLPRGRIRFLAPDGEERKTPLQGQAVFYVGTDVEGFARVFGDLGIVVHAVLTAPVHLEAAP